MSDYSSFGSSGGGSYGASQERGRVMDQVRSQIAVANLQEMIIVMNFCVCARDACVSLDLGTRGVAVLLLTCCSRASPTENI